MDRRLVAPVGHHDVAQPLLEVLEVARQAQDRHDLGGDGDVEPASRGKPFATPPSDTTMSRSARSFMSMTRRQTIRRWSMSSALPQ
jgi:hypothetical protein